jgi:hypothetical protein
MRKQIPDLTALAEPAAGDLLLVRNIASGEDRKVEVGNLPGGGGGGVELVASGSLSGTSTTISSLTGFIRYQMYANFSGLGNAEEITARINGLTSNYFSTGMVYARNSSGVAELAAGSASGSSFLLAKAIEVGGVIDGSVGLGFIWDVWTTPGRFFFTVRSSLYYQSNDFRITIGNLHLSGFHTNNNNSISSLTVIGGESNFSGIYRLYGFEEPS